MDSCSQNLKYKNILIHLELINLSELVNEAKQQPSLQCEPCITYVITIIIIIVIIIIIIIIFLYSFSLLINSSSFNKAMKEGKKRKLLIKVL